MKTIVNIYSGTAIASFALCADNIDTNTTIPLALFAISGVLAIIFKNRVLNFLK
ncbi:hypothetical protein OZ664_11935 [Elizabethkingia sp. HX WHF]|uniref:Uncharacterized protein n=1 Tax=Elizabethkingia miricola TaxID=172045 RepID=A0ABY3NBS3_ELIMR|nr:MULTISPECIES: hypothetical protein [Elizabethkingia]MDX8564711.1 hypothetical protein [Elizabethkingia sp. HX WHF]TYO84970.1 hypothetical protein LX74_03775 [Elizabethkingia miricola]